MSTHTINITGATTGIAPPTSPLSSPSPPPRRAIFDVVKDPQAFSLFVQGLSTSTLSSVRFLINRIILFLHLFVVPDSANAADRPVSASLALPDRWYPRTAIRRMGWCWWRQLSVSRMGRILHSRNCALPYLASPVRCTIRGKHSVSVWFVSA